VEVGRQGLRVEAEPSEANVRLMVQRTYPKVRDNVHILAYFMTVDTVTLFMTAKTIVSTFFTIPRFRLPSTVRSIVSTLQH
jgi:hypothetical protein